MHPSAERVQRLLTEAGCAGRVHELADSARAGTPDTVFPTAYDELLKLTAGAPADVRERRGQGTAN